MTVTFNIVTSARDIEQGIGDEIARHAYNTVYNPLAKLKREVKKFVEESIEKSPEADELIHGFLKYEFGLVDPQYNVARIIEGIIDAADIKPIPFRYVGRAELSGSINISVLQKDLRDVLGLDAASFTSDKGFNVPWLSWLLLGKDATLISGYHISWSPVHQDYSRTGGGALMHPGGEYTFAKSPFFPPALAGVSGDNWLTRALAKIDAYLYPLVEAEFRRAFN